MIDLQPPAAREPEVVNALSFDVEDYFHVSAFERVVRRERWQNYESRVERNTERLLSILDGAGARATFFVLGWVAEQVPALIRKIAAAGHEIASHGYGHELLYRLRPANFRADLDRARSLLEDITGTPLSGYRAPSFSITSRSLWALDILIEAGYRYDASVFPIRRDRYGLPSAPRHPYRVSCEAGSILEIPGSTLRVGGVNLPIGGGGYFRLMPYAWSRWAITTLNRSEGRPAIFYLHPWEIDPDQPRIPASLLSRYRHYVGLHRTEARLERLLAEFRFAPIATVFAQQLDPSFETAAALVARAGSGAALA